MMNIGLVISGNLTGFSRFYANDEAKNLLNTTKFNFDVHNLVSFLNNGEKLYALFFSKDIIAVSLITNILDSFRRPGNLVITVLIPRGYKIVDGLSLSRTNALYHLLNEVNDKFYERNFLNGMVNQNPAVLMQDYYSDILSQYTFVTDRMQKPVNSRIDVTSPNKRIGYVAATESSIPQYLSSLMRKSYEGYHYIFIASNAPQNIDEPAEEILTYKVRIEKRNRPVPGEVRLTDRIPNINPEQGEKDIPNKNFTYGQVISGEAGSDIIGTIENGETIVLSYRFPEEEKTVYFRFYEGAHEVPFVSIRPIIEDSNGAHFNIPSDSYTFYGKEIYGRKTIKSGNFEYSIVETSANLDLQRVQNGATININVEKEWLWQFAPKSNNQQVTIKPVNIILINDSKGKRITFNNVTSAFSKKLSGNQSEWTMVINSDYYKDVRVPINTPYRLESKPVQQRPNTPAGTNGNGGCIVNSHNSTTSTGQNNLGLRIPKGDQLTAKDSEQIRREKNKRFITYGVAFVVACLLAFGGYWCYKALFGEKKTDNSDKDHQEEVFAGESHNENKTVAFKFIGIDGDSVSKNTLDKLTISFNPERIVEPNSENFDYTIKYNQDSEPSDKIKINVSYVGCDMLAKDFKNIFEIKKLPNVVTVTLSVKESDINLYDRIVAGVSPKDYDDLEGRVRDITDNLNGTYGTILSQKLFPQKPTNLAQTKEPHGNGDVKPNDNKKTPEAKAPPFDLGWTLSKVKDKKKQPEYQNYLAQLTAIEKTLTGLKAGKIVIPENLPNNFKEVMIDLKGLEDRINKISDESKKSATIKTLRDVIKDKSESVNKERDNLVPGCKIDNRIKTAEK